AGIVYYANYLRYIERARSELVRDVGIDQVAMRADGLVFAVAHVDATYLAPARYDDTLVIETTVTARTAARCVMGQVLFRGDAPLLKADVTIVCMTPEGRPRRLPAAMAALAVTGP
ncbi:MAG: YbgC/FadM family acyl-CoA thioesterase, partial [Pseudomonadota bacterium]